MLIFPKKSYGIIYIHTTGAYRIRSTHPLGYPLPEAGGDSSSGVCVPGLTAAGLFPVCDAVGGARFISRRPRHPSTRRRSGSGADSARMVFVWGMPATQRGSLKLKHGSVILESDCVMDML